MEIVFLILNDIVNMEYPMYSICMPASKKTASRELLSTEFVFEKE